VEGKTIHVSLFDWRGDRGRGMVTHVEGLDFALLHILLLYY
jgi:hypothetical protein